MIDDQKNLRKYIKQILIKDKNDQINCFIKEYNINNDTLQVIILEDNKEINIRPKNLICIKVNDKVFQITNQN